MCLNRSLLALRLCLCLLSVCLSFCLLSIFFSLSLCLCLFLSVNLSLLLLLLFLFFFLLLLLPKSRLYFVPEIFCLALLPLQPGSAPLRSEDPLASLVQFRCPRRINDLYNICCCCSNNRQRQRTTYNSNNQVTNGLASSHDSSLMKNDLDILRLCTTFKWELFIYAKS